jgi:hypothetical protein
MESCCKDLIDRLNKGISELKLTNQVYDVFFDESEDIVTIKLLPHVDQVQFYATIESNGVLKKNDQIAISWL